MKGNPFREGYDITHLSPRLGERWVKGIADNGIITV
jgi:hypothetical protein